MTEKYADKAHGESFLSNNMKQKESIEFISTLLALSAILYGIARNIYNYLYSINAGHFYGIPIRYFLKNNSGVYNVLIIIIFSYTLFFLFPSIVRKTLKNDKYFIFYRISFSLIMSVILFEILLVSFLALYSANILSTDICNALYIISFLTAVCFFIYYKFFCLKFVGSEEGLRDKTCSKIYNITFRIKNKLTISSKVNIEENEINTLKKKDNAGNSKVLTFYFIILFVVIIVTPILFSHFPNLSEKTNYEIAIMKETGTNNNDEYMLIVGEYNDYAILLNVLEIEDEVLKFEKGSYKFEKIDKLVITNESFEKVISE